MRLLLDTHIVLWALTRHARFTRQLQQRISEADSAHVSVASIWEICIKVSAGKLELDPQALLKGIADSGLQMLPITSAHATGVATLPLHHRDPFDRLLIAQAIAEPLRLLTADARLLKYSELVELAG